MGQKVSPIGLRSGIIRTWTSRWFAEGNKYSKWLHEDILIRKALFKKLKDAAVSKVIIERVNNEVKIFIHTARPGVVLGQESKNLGLLKTLLQKTIKNRKQIFKIEVVTIEEPNLDAQLVANSIAQQISNRASFRIVQKQAIRRCLKSGALGVKTSVSGRLGGVEMARTEGYLEGRMPLSTLRNDIDYALAEAYTTYGQIGVKVWLCKGEVFANQKEGFKPKKNNFRNRKPNKFNPNFRKGGQQ